MNWDGLWTDPPPPLEPGLVTKEPQDREDGLSYVDGEDSRWNDVGARWDALVGAEGDIDAGEIEKTLVNGSHVAAVRNGPTPVDDGIGWAEDAHGTEFERYKLKDAGTFRRASRIVEEVGPTGELPDYALPTTNGSAHVDPSAAAENVNANGTDGAAKVANKSNVVVAITAHQELERGRNRALTPVQGNGWLRDSDL